MPETRMEEPGVLRVLVVDDEPLMIRTVARQLRGEEYRLLEAASVAEALDVLARERVDLVLMDMTMPGLDGLSYMEYCQADDRLAQIPVIFLTGTVLREIKEKAFALGAVDFIAKPFDELDLKVRIRAQLRLKILRDEVREKNRLLADRAAHLHTLVEEKTRELRELGLSLVNALENVNFYNDQETGRHLRRVGFYSASLAKALNMDETYVDRIHLFAPLHDVGKVGLPDALLKKKGPFSETERQIMQSHVLIGARILENARIDVMARNIALYHHERWDGSGYLEGLSGSDIPLEARIVALADVYDALSMSRVYRDALDAHAVESYIIRDSGAHFDPDLVRVFQSIRGEWELLRDRWYLEGEVET